MFSVRIVGRFLLLNIYLFLRLCSTSCIQCLPLPRKRPTILRVWANVFNEDESGITAKLLQPTFIAGVDLRVTTHNVLSLTTGLNAHFMVNPPLRENGPLVAWYNDHIEEVNQLIQSEAYRSTDFLLSPPLETDILPVQRVSDNMATLKTAWVFGKVFLIPAQNRLWQTICDKCKKTVPFPVGSDLPCFFYKKEMNVEARCHMHVFLNDGSGTISATLFATNAEKLIGHTVLELVEAANKVMFCFVKKTLLLVMKSVLLLLGVKAQ